MDDCYDGIILLIQKWKAFRALEKDGDIPSFANWLVNENQPAFYDSDQEDFIIEQVDKMEEKEAIPIMPLMRA